MPICSLRKLSWSSKLGSIRGLRFEQSTVTRSMKVIKFTPELTELIKKGEKSTTFRLFDDKNLTKGDEVILATRDGKKVAEFAKAKLTEVYIKTIKDLNADDYKGHEPIRETSLEDYKKYCGIKVTEDTEVKIVRFKIIK